MNTNTLKKFAQQARRKLLEQIEAKLDMVLTTDSAELREKSAQISKLREAINITSREQVIEKVAYTWFNRLMALRFMDANDYQPTGISIVTPREGYTTPEILEEAKQGMIPDDLQVKRQHIFDVLDGKIPASNPQNEAYKELLTGACNHLHTIFPFLFERINDYTELLLPEDLTSEFSIVHDVRTGMTNEDCREVEIIGWLYQFYISEKNNELINSKKKYEKSELAPASQLFTPKWIVRYMVDNTLGQLWVELSSDTKVHEDLDFYITPAYNDQLKPRDTKSIEQITFFDPCTGSGHILSYAFDVFYKMYEEQGYNPSEIPELIITHNLFGADIDQRAAQLASFVLLMKGRQKSRRFFRIIRRKNLQPNILFFQDFDFDEKFSNASALGSLIKIDQNKEDSIEVDETSLFGERQEELRKVYSLLSMQYDIVVTNPPYISSSRMEGSLKQFVEQNYPDTKTDLFATFIVRCLELTKRDGFTGYMSPFVWMFISNYQKLRANIINNHHINNLIQLEYSGFDGATVPICTFTLRKNPMKDARGNYIRLSDFKGSKLQAPKTLEAINNPDCGWYYTANQKDFEKIPGSPIGYWLSKSWITNFEKNNQLGKVVSGKSGMSTCDNDRFMRLWTEIEADNFNVECNSHEEGIASGKKWFPYGKGGSFRKWFGNNFYVVNWGNNGSDIKNYVVNNPRDPKTTHWSRRIFNIDSFYKLGITYSDVSSGDPAFRLQRQGVIFSGRGPLIISKDLSLLAFLNSKVAKETLKLIAPTLTFNIGDILKLPYCKKQINVDVNSIIQVSTKEWNSRETSWDFLKNELIRINGHDLEEALDLYQQYWTNKFYQLHHNEEELNAQFIEIYGLQEELTPDVPLNDITILKEELDQKALKKISESYKSGWELKDDKWHLTPNTQNLTPKPTLPFNAKEIFAQFISYAVGCMFGRYSLDKEGLILANQGETLEDYLDKVLGVRSEELGDNLKPNTQNLTPSFLPDDDNIIPVLDDDWFEDDITGRFTELLKVSFGKENLEKNLAFVKECIGMDIRKYFIKEFYKDHIKRYKKRPIYWMFSSPKGSFNVLIYMHRYTPDTLSRVLTGYLNAYREKLNTHIEQLDRLIETGTSAEQTRASKEKDKMKLVLLELQEYERDILYPIASERIAIDLDDGVLVNYNKFGKAIKPVPGLNDKKTKDKVRGFDWIDTEEIRS